MAENISRFGLSEMMNVLRDAVRTRREPKSCLTASEVSKYIQNRYGNHQTRSKSTANIAPNFPLLGEENMKQATSTQSVVDQSQSRPRTKSLPRHLYSKEDEKVQFQETKPPISYPPAKAVTPVGNKLTSLGLSRSLESDIWYNHGSDYRYSELDLKERNIKADSSILQAKKAMNTFPRQELSKNWLNRRLHPTFDVNVSTKNKLASLGMSRSQESQLRVLPPNQKERNPKKVEEAGNQHDRKTPPKKAMLHDRLRSQNMLLRTREAIARVEEQMKLTEQRKQLDVLRMMAEERLQQAKDEQRELRRSEMRSKQGGYMF